MDEQYRLLLQIRATAQGTQSTFAALRRDIGGLRRDLQAFNREFSGLGRGFRALMHLPGLVFGGMRVLAGTALSAVRGLLSGVLSLAAAMGRTLLGAAQSVFGIMRTGAIAAVGGLTAAMVLLGRQGVSVNQSLASTEMGLTVMMGSAAKAKEFLQALREEAKRSAFEFVDLADYSKRLLAFGFAAETIIPMLRTLGDVSAATGGGTEKLERLMLAFGQIQAKGRVQGEELMQIMEAGVSARKYLNLKPGEEVGKLKATDPRTQAETAIPMLLAGMQKQFGGMQGGFMGTFAGSASNLKDIINDLTASITHGFYRSLTAAMQKLSAFLDGLQKTKSGQRIIEALTRAFDGVGRMIERAVGYLPALAKGVADWLDAGNLEKWWRAAVTAFEIVRRWAGAVVDWLKENWADWWDKAKLFTIGAVKVIGGSIAALKVYIDHLLGDPSTVLTALMAITEGFKRMAIAAIHAVAGIAKEMSVLMLQWSSLQAILGTGMMAFAPTRKIGAQMAASGAAGMAQATFMGMMAGRAGQRATELIGGIDPMQIATGAKEWFDRARAARDQYRGQRNVGGQMVEAYEGFGRSVDEFMGQFNQPPPAPAPSPGANITVTLSGVALELVPDKVREVLEQQLRNQYGPAAVGIH